MQFNHSYFLLILVRESRQIIGGVGIPGIVEFMVSVATLIHVCNTVCHFFYVYINMLCFHLYENEILDALKHYAKHCF